MWQVPDHETGAEAADSSWVLQLAYPTLNIGNQIPLLLTTLYGECASSGNVKLLDVHLPASFVAAFPGPRLGIDGIRERLGVFDRPLLLAMVFGLVAIAPLECAEATRLRCEYRQNPEGIGEKLPRLDWILQADPAARAVKQTAYRVLVASSRELLAQEKEHTHARDKVNAARLALPWVKMEKTYVFDTLAGRKSLSELFDGRSQLIVYHFMFGPTWEAGCPGCSFLADHFAGMRPHLNHHDVTLTAASNAPLAKIEAYRKRMDWHFPWVVLRGRKQ